ncbi:MAG: hypothetical protein Q9219_001075 [cf. Caloplaca sp. 3 TL-2023]
MSASRLCDRCSSQLLGLYRYGFCARGPTAGIKNSSVRCRRLVTSHHRTFATRSQKRQQVSHSTDETKNSDQLSHTVTKTRQTFGETLPEGFLSAEEYRVYERLYGPPAAVTNPRDVGSLQDLVQTEVATGDDGQNVIFREDDRGNLEPVGYAPKSSPEKEDGEVELEEPLRNEPADVTSDAQTERTLDTDFDARFATYREEVAASGAMDKVSETEETTTVENEQPEADERLAKDIQEAMEQQAEEEEDVEEVEDPLDAYTYQSGPRHHPLTAAGKWGPDPMTIHLPKDTFIDPISTIFSEASNKHLTEVAQKVFGGKWLPNSTATPLPKMVGENLKQSPIALEAFQSSMGEMEANAYLAAIMPGAYASTFSCLIETRKRLGSEWLQDLLRRDGGPRVLDAGSGGAGVLAWRELLRNEWELMHPDQNLEKQRVPFGKSTVVTGSSSLRQRASTLLDNTTFLPRLPDYNPSVDHPSLEQSTGAQRKQYDLILAPYTLWNLQEDHVRKTHIQNLWSLLKPGGVLLVLEKGVPRGFELVAGAREVLLKFHIASPGDTKFENRIDEPLEGRYREKETGMIIAPCTSHGKCPMYLFSGKTVARRDYCHFIQRYIRPPFLQRILGQTHRNHEDIRFSFVAVQRGVDLRRTLDIKQGQEAEDDAFAGYDQKISAGKRDGGETSEDSQEQGHDHPPSINPLSFPRIILSPLKNRGHIIIDACTPAGKLERWTVTRSFGKRAYADARKARWGDLWALGAKIRVPRRLKLGREAVKPRKQKQHRVDIHDNGDGRTVRRTPKPSKGTKRPKYKNKTSEDDINI